MNRSSEGVNIRLPIISDCSLDAVANGSTRRHSDPSRGALAALHAACPHIGQIRPNRQMRLRERLRHRLPFSPPWADRYSSRCSDDLRLTNNTFPASNGYRSHLCSSVHSLPSHLPYLAVHVPVGVNSSDWGVNVSIPMLWDCSLEAGDGVSTGRHSDPSRGALAASRAVGALTQRRQKAQK